MRTLIFWGLVLLQQNAITAQVANGIVADQKNNQPIPYVNIGVKGHNLGTISDEQGKFEFSLSQSQPNDTVTIQHISYESKSIAVSDLVALRKIFLTEKTAVLDEVHISSKTPKKKKFGIQSHNPLLHGGLGLEKESIYEIAQEIRIKKRTRLLDLNIYFRIYSDSLPFMYRIKFYSSIDNAPGDLLGNANILVAGLKPKWNTVDLEPYDIIREDNFFVSIEFMPVPNREIPYMAAGSVLLGGNRYSRNVSFGSWNKAMGGFSLYVTGEY